MTDSLGKEGPSKQSKTLHTQMEEEEEGACGEEAPAEDPMAKLTPQELLAHQEVEREQALQQDEAEKELQEKHHAEDVKEELGRTCR